jgi:predicted dehydrogenase
MVRQARQMVRDGLLGEIRVVQVEYPQEWLTEALEASGQKQAEWRSDPARSGAGGAIADIGCHAHHLAAYVTGLELDELCADLSRFVKGRALDDNAQVMLRYAGGARGLLWASQVAPGNQNNLRLRVYGSLGGIDWRQEQPNQLWWSPFGQPTQLLERGTTAANAAATRVSRIPPGHPEGYLEGFATLYAEIAQAIRATRPGGPKADSAVEFPTLADGLKGVEFVEAVLRSSARGGRWVRMPR